MINDLNVQSEIAHRLGYKSLDRYRFRGKSLFRNIPLDGKRVLEVGCGKGTWAIWAGLNGANESVGIEPEAHGSTSGTFAKFKSILTDYPSLKNVRAQMTSLEALKTDQKFDVIVMFNVINHINETAVVDLHKNPAHRAEFIQVIRQLRDLLKPGGHIIVTDCGRSNFWHTIGLKSPLAPTIEWHKHQEPETWIELFQEAGFRLLDKNYSPLYPFGFITQNKLVNHLTTSHFILRFRV